MSEATIVLHPASQNGSRAASRSPSVSMDIDEGTKSPSVSGSLSPIKGKGKEVDRSNLRSINISTLPARRPSASPIASTSTPSTGSREFSLSPAPTSATFPAMITHTQVPTRKRLPSVIDSSEIDQVSIAALPSGKPPPPPPPPPPVIELEQPPAKRSRPFGPTPLPPGPPTVQNVRILLEPEHIDLNRPKQLFDLVRMREGQGPRVNLSPGEMKEVLENMRRVNEIWLRTMAEDEGNLQCLASWLKSFINNPKPFEGIVVPLIWVILKAKPSFDKLKAGRFGILAKQALEVARKHSLAKTLEIEKAVDNMESLINMKKASRNAAAEANGAPVKKSMPSFKKSNSASELPPVASGSGGSGSASTTTAVRPPPAAAPKVPELSALQKLLASVNKPAVPPAPVANDTKPTVRPSGFSSSSNLAARPPPPTAGSSMFRPVPQPTPLVVNRSTRPPPASAASSNASKPQPSPRYPSESNRWSSVPNPAGQARGWDNKRMPNWRNCSIRYRDDALAEAREFEQYEVEAEEPYWWKYATNTSADGHASHDLDREEGATMKHVNGAEPTIAWYDPPVYDPLNTTVQPVATAETLTQDMRERGVLMTSYYGPADIPPSPAEPDVQAIRAVPPTKPIPPPPRAFIPPAQHYYIPPPPAQPMANNNYTTNSSYQPRNAATTTSSSFRPRNPPPAVGASMPAYRPRATSAPAPSAPQPPATERRASTPGPDPAPKVMQHCAPSNNVPSYPDRLGRNYEWSRTARPKKSALLNPLSSGELAMNRMALDSAPPMDYRRYDIEDDGSDTVEDKPFVGGGGGVKFEN